MRVLLLRESFIWGVEGAYRAIEGDWGDVSLGMKRASEGSLLWMLCISNGE